MKLLERLYNWLSSEDPTGKIKAHKEKKKERLFEDASPDFLAWAFGDGHEFLNMNDKMIAWNRLHGDKLKIEQVDHMHDALLPMGALWAQSIQVK
jgi:hypothetical protein